jgi:hypothetical protein
VCVVSVVAVATCCLLHFLTKCREQSNHRRTRFGAGPPAPTDSTCPPRDDAAKRVDIPNRPWPETRHFSSMPCAAGRPTKALSTLPCTSNGIPWCSIAPYGPTSLTDSPAGSQSRLQTAKRGWIRPNFEVFFAQKSSSGRVSDRHEKRSTLCHVLTRQAKVAMN